jgi:nucleoside-diphosphate-sugar epimerase
LISAGLYQVQSLFGCAVMSAHPFHEEVHAMRVFVTGASGHIASAVIPELVSAGHSVVGLARSDRSATAVAALGAEVRMGDLDDLDGLGAAAREADGVIHLAFKHDAQRSGDLAGAVAADLRAVETMGAALKGSGKPFVGTSATGALALAGFQGWLTERDTLPGGPRIDAENTVIALAGCHVRSSVVRLPPTVHSLGRYGFVSALTAIARASRVAGYVGDGANRWPSADTRDVGHLYRLALESAPAGSRLHAVAEEGITLRDTAAAIGRTVGVPVATVSSQDAERHFGFLSGFVGLDNPVSSRITRDTLGWAPTRPGLIADLDGADGSAPDSTRTPPEQHT